MTSPSASPAAVVQFRPEQLELSRGVPLGSGAISHVVQCRLRCAADPALPVVVKIVSKVQVLQQGKVQSIMNEKAALQRLGPHPYIARLYGTSQSEDELYYVLEWLPHGDLLQHIRRAHLERVRAYNKNNNSSSSSSHREGQGSSADNEATRVTAIPATSTALRCLDFHDIQLIAAQLVLALAQLSAKHVVLRDLKPENVAFDEKHRACLLDFDTVDLDGAANVPETNGGVACPPPCPGAADVDEGPGDAVTSISAASQPAPQPRRLTVSEIQGMRKKSASFCGTAQYVSPEMVGECKWSFSSDLWALGALVYEMAYGTHLFAGLSQFEVLQKVIQGDYIASGALFPTIDFGESQAPATESSNFVLFKDFVQQLLNIDPAKRLGVNAATRSFDEAALRAHPFFHGVAWASLEEQLDTFRVRTFAASGPKKEGAPLSRVHHASAFDDANAALEAESDDSSEDEESTAAAAAAAAEALKALTDASVDPSPTLAYLYHVLPHNDPSYAEYVYRATADANPFEKYFVDASSSTASLKVAKSAEGAAKAVAATTRAATAAEKPAQKNAAGDTRDEVDDVIDDVGMRYLGSHAHPDFQE